jgi:methylase of polypeptide subunit release factors
MHPTDQALVRLGQELKACNYHFTTITPASHRRVNARTNDRRDVLARVFGWSQPFAPAELPHHILALLEEAGALEQENGSLRSSVRFSTLGAQLFVHSAFPTDAPDSVFFGPDTYRFIRALRQALRDFAAQGSCTVIDIGAGSGAGGLCVAGLLGRQLQPDIILADVNPKALRYSRINAILNSIPRVRTVLSDVFSRINEGGNLIIANPPYLVDPPRRAYRDGGGPLGMELALRIAEEGLNRLYPGGRLFLYTGTPVIAGVDQFFSQIRSCLETRALHYTYEEIDPDVFSEELESAAYAEVDRIAVVALTADVKE